METSLYIGKALHKLIGQLEHKLLHTAGFAMQISSNNRQKGQSCYGQPINTDCYREGELREYTVTFISPA